MQNGTHKASTITSIGCHNLDKPWVAAFDGEHGAKHIALHVTPQVTLYFDSFAEFHRWVSALRVEVLDMRAEEVA